MVSHSRWRKMDKKIFLKCMSLKKKQGVPKGANEAVHEQCVHDLKAKGHDKASAFAICNAAGAGKKKKKLKKAEGSNIDFQSTKVAISAELQAIAEETANPEILDTILRALSSDSKVAEFEEGTLTISEREPGLYSAFFSDKDGQIIDEFFDATPEILAKLLELKKLVGVLKPEIQEDTTEEEPQEVPVVENSPSYLRIKMGDFELELKKSINDFIKGYRSNKEKDIRKALEILKKNARINSSSEAETAKILRDNWEEYLEDFIQTVSVMRMKNK